MKMIASLGTIYPRQKRYSRVFVVLCRRFRIRMNENESPCLPTDIAAGMNHVRGLCLRFTIVDATNRATRWCALTTRRAHPLERFGDNCQV